MAIPPANQDRRRVIIEGVRPEIDAGRFPIKRVVGEEVVVEADVFADGHEALCAVLLSRHSDQAEWLETPMEELGNDRWRACFTVTELGCHRYTIRGWIDPFGSWRRDLEKKLEAGVSELHVDLQTGALLVADAVERALKDVGSLGNGLETSLGGSLPSGGGTGVGGHDGETVGNAATSDMAALRAFGHRMADDQASVADRIEAALDPRLAVLARRYPDLEKATTYERELDVIVDRERALFGSWYELFPRSCVEGRPELRHATLSDCAARLEYVAGLGFDVVYLPPIHPIGQSHRKGPNNVTSAGPEDPGSPWAIGSEAGGHTAIEPRLGTIDDFLAFVDRARKLGMEVALDLAYQCSPDHPWVKEHPGWFRRRPNGTVQYAENPPKKYEDIYPINFETPDWRDLWEELARVVYYWIDRGVRIFRVDNPHTKPFPFWEWLIGTVKEDHPDVVFLSEAFTRPKVMKRLAKLGFTQSYTYFTWRNTKWELEEYLTELTRTEAAEYLRPNLWPNTPDILHDYLQTGGRPAFVIRLILSATLSASYGIYGPPFELVQNLPREPGSEEYLDSEKYEVRRWDLEQPDSLGEVIGLINAIRRDNPALRTNRTLLFHPVDNEQIVCYSKQSPDGDNVIIVIVNLDPYHTHHGWLSLDLGALRIDPAHSFQVHDLLSGAHYFWQGPHNYVELDPHSFPAHVLRLQRHSRTEQDFGYYM